MVKTTYDIAERLDERKMARIDHAEIIGIRMAESGSGGYTINSTFYSVLIFYTDGSREIVEGEYNQIRFLLPYVLPSNNTEHIREMLNDFECKIIRDIKEIIHAEIVRTEEMRYPIPDIRGKDRFEVRNILTAEGLSWVEEGHVSETISGTVIGYERAENAFKEIKLRIRYNFPDVKGLEPAVAMLKLQELGFLPLMKKVFAKGQQDFGKVIYTEYDSGLKILLCIADSGSNLFFDKIRSETSMIAISKIWEESGLGASHPKTTSFIKNNKEIERMYGRSSNIKQIIQNIEQVFLSE